MQAEGDLELLVGPTCAGKSFYLGGLEPRPRVLFLFEEGGMDRVPGEQHVVHYNLLHPYDRPKFRLGRIRSWRKLLAHWWNRRIAENPFARDLGRVAKLSPDMRATVLVARREVLLERLARREALEPVLASMEGKRYDRERWRRVYDEVDLTEVYRAFVMFAREQGIAVRFVNSEADYGELDEAAAFRMVKGS